MHCVPLCSQQMKVYKAGVYQAGCTGQGTLTVCNSCTRQPLPMQVVAALHFMHNHPLYSVSNRDVKAANVLITAYKPNADGVYRPIVKIADFGFADRDRRKTRLGTVGAIAPEVYNLPFAPPCLAVKMCYICICIWPWAVKLCGHFWGAVSRLR
jgi:serine/threonine protein kinase